MQCPSHNREDTQLEEHAQHRLPAALRLLRPTHWVKNLFVFAPLVFAGKALDPSALVGSGLTFAGFCLLSSAIYSFNDIVDAEEDRLHPRKKSRPVASGELSPRSAGVLMVVALVCGCVLIAVASRGLLVLAACFLALHVVYTLWLKRCMLVDVMCIAAGFVLRAVAGGIAVGVPVSLWLLACTFTLCLFLGFGKRRCEVAALDREGASDHRETLYYYSLRLLDHLLSVTAGLAVVTYLLYTVQPRTIEKVKTPYLLFSVPFVIYCIFRMTLRMEAGEVDGPTQVVIRDKPFIASFLLWVVYVVCVVTWGPEIQAYVGGLTGKVLEW